MRSKTLRLLILISTVLITIIMLVQLFWLQKVYRYEEKQFNINVSKSIHGLYKDMQLVNDVNDNTQKEIENPQPDLYLLKIHCTPYLDSLWLNLKAEFTDFNVYTDCQAAIYSPEKKLFIYTHYIDLPDDYYNINEKINIPLLQKNYAYVALFFPYRKKYILNQMYFWMASSGLLLLVLIAFGSSVFYLYRQKFLNETQKDFVNNFTHEFKTPLSVIKIASEVLQQPDINNKPDKLKNYATIINEQSTHLEAQTQRLLEIAYTNSKTLSLQKEKFNVNELLQQAINSLHPLIEQKNALIKTLYSNHINSITGDKYYILLAFINLLENAVKYATKPCITITTHAQGKFCIITFADNGIGISEENLKKIFTPFFRVTHGNLHTAKGFGLGLNFVKKVIEAHHGKIEVKSQLDNGSIFTIKLLQL